MKIFKFAWPGLIAATILFAFPKENNKNADSGVLTPEIYHHREQQMITFLLSRNHYQNKTIDDSLSSAFYKNYIERLDGSRVYLLKSDIESFKHYRLELDDALQAGNLDAAYHIFNVFMTRFNERMEYALRLLEKPFDFSIDEYYQPDREYAPWAENSAELDEIWRKLLKNEALKLKLAGKKEDEINKNLVKRYKNYIKRLKQSESEDVFQYFMNAFAETFDPHTGYMSPKRSEDFKIQMSHSLEGIGALLNMEDDYTKVVEIVPGGPADKAGNLQANDRISAVGQGAGSEMVDVIGWRIDDVVRLIRGPKGTSVRLQIHPADAPIGAIPKTISIVRDKVRLADRAAKSDTIDFVENGRRHRIGVIEIADFYSDYEAKRKGDPNYSSTSNDVKRILGELKSADVDGIVVDLRGNGGGFLDEAIKLSGLFIKDGPVVQVRYSGGKVEVNNDTDSRVFYDGPLVVLVDRLSASASEIFSAAIQDYGRGIIAGDQSFGKGTVQNVVDLQRFLPRNGKKYGQIKLTVAKFYRINGGSTQNVGVIPDISFPSKLEAMEVGERYQEFALLWDRIKKAPYEQVSEDLKEIVPRLESSHRSRMKENEKYTNLIKEIDRIKDDRSRKLLSLQENKRRKLLEESKKHKVSNSDYEEFVLNEAVNIMSDYISIIDRRLQSNAGSKLPELIK